MSVQLSTYNIDTNTIHACDLTHIHVPSKSGLLGDPGPPAARPVKQVQDIKPGSVRVVKDATETQGKQRPVTPGDVLVCTL